jgi:arginyl-tRNA synthetase
MSSKVTEALSKLDLMVESAQVAQSTTVANSHSVGSRASSAVSYSTVKDELSHVFEIAIQAAFPSLGSDFKVLVAACNNPANGDYQCNNAMALFGRLKGVEGAPKNPRAVAEAILANIPANDMIGETSLAGPGFINIRLDKTWLSSRMTDMLNSPEGLKCWSPPQFRGKKVIVDFSSPNVAKEMHVGHLRSTIIGDTIAKSLEYCGADVLRLNHIGDWGTQFGMLIQYISEKRPEGLNAASDEDVADLQVLYRAAKQRFDEEEDFKTRSREAVKELQGGKPEYVQAWKRICDASRTEFEKIYSRLGVTIQERGESFYNPFLGDVVDDLLSRGIAEMSDGAACVFVECQKIPLIVRKSDGGYGYASTDMAALRHRINQEHADWIIYVTDSGQSVHFDMVFEAAKKAGYIPEDREVRIDHVPFGLVLGDDGKKFRSRSGDVVRLVELLDEAKQRCTSTIKERRPDISDEELDEASSAMGYGAVKYADLKGHRTTNYRFSFDDMLSLQGNTAVYLLYAHARINSIFVKSGKDPLDLIAQGKRVEIGHEAEAALAKHLTRFPEAIEGALNELAPNRITDYLYDLSGYFNQFYQECKVIGSDEEDSRLLLAHSAALAMRACFTLLGITPLFRI